MPTTAQTHVERAIDDLAGRLGVDRDSISVEEYRDVTWSDGSLGCPREGMSYVQRLVPGSLLVLRANGVSFEYHSGETGELFYCATPRLPAGDRGVD